MAVAESCMDMAKGKMGSLMGYIRHIVLSTVLGLSAMPVVITRQPLLECRWAYCSTGEYCDDVMGCTGCDMICQPDVMYPECQKQCPGEFTLHFMIFCFADLVTFIVIFIVKHDPDLEVVRPI